MKFPVTVLHRRAEATIYGKTPAYPFYRVAYRAAGKRLVRSFATFAEARQEAEAKVRELAKGSQSVALTPKESGDALAIRDALAGFHRETGRNISALQAVTGYLDAVKLLPAAHNLTDAVKGYLRTVIAVRRKPLKEAVTEFSDARKPKAVPKPGKLRSELHPTYVKDTTRWLNEVAAMFPNHAVCDLTKDHLDSYVAAHAALSAKSRNDRRTTLKLFLRWCIAKDYLSPTHRLFEAVGLRNEPLDAAPTDFYRPNELRALLENSTDEMRVVIALQALAGLRLQEALRLDWSEVFGIPGHVEVSSARSKSRQRRLVEICPALEQWLQPYRGMEGKVVKHWQTVNGYVHAFIELRRSLKIPSRQNGLRHGFITFRYAQIGNENQTAAQAGNSPAMIHQHYKGLATKAEAEKWFNVRPAKVDNVIPLQSKEAL